MNQKQCISNNYFVDFDNDVMAAQCPLAINMNVSIYSLIIALAGCPSSGTNYLVSNSVCHYTECLHDRKPRCGFQGYRGQFFPSAGGCGFVCPPIPFLVRSKPATTVKPRLQITSSSRLRFMYLFVTILEHLK